MVIVSIESLHIKGRGMASTLFSSSVQHYHQLPPPVLRCGSLGFSISSSFQSPPSSTMKAQTQEELLAEHLEQQKIDSDEPVIEDEDDEEEDDEKLEETDDKVYEEEDAEGDRDATEGEGRNAADEDEEDEDEEGQDEYEKDGFIVDDDEEEEEQDEEDQGRGNSEEEERHKKKRKKKRESEKNYVLDEDDYELLQDNNITGFHRPKPGSQKFKRLKKAGRDSEEEGRSGFSDEEETGRSGQGGRSAEEKLKLRLFGDDEAAPLEDIVEEEQQEEEEDVDIGEDDEMADFIVDEEDVDEDGTVVRKKKLKKKKIRQAAGVSSSALQEAHEIFGDVDELLMLRKKGLEMSGADSGTRGEKRLEDEFEPQVIENNYMTTRDVLIRETDVPERIQLVEEITGSPPVDDNSIEEEARWIYDQLSSGTFSAFLGKSLESIDNDDRQKKYYKEDIGNVLMMLHLQKFDIPFIAMYRKELCLNLLKDPEQDLYEIDDVDSGKAPKMRWHKVLWAIQSLDMKWLLIQKRKSALLSYYTRRFEEETRRTDDERRLVRNQQLYKSIIDALNDARSEREVDDVDMKFNLHFPPGEIDADEGQFKRPKRKSLYSICCKAGLWEVANKFGRSAEQLGLFLALDARLDELEDAKETPEEVATNFTCTMFEKPEDVLKGARHMASVEISCEPNIRKHVRTTFMENAVVSTCPTTEGNIIIDDFHQLSKVKWLKQKPLSEFVDGQWLLIQKAEEEKLLQVSISLPEHVKEKLLTESRDYYISDFVSKSAQLWNVQRELILNDSFFNLILPSMEKEARLVLTTRAKNWLLVEYGEQLWKKISMAPYQHKDNKVIDEDESTPRVMACCWGPGKPATTFVMLDSAGEVLDVLYAGSISIRSQGISEQRRKNDQQRLLKFMTDHQPNVICVGAANITCRTLKDEINEVIYKILEHHPREVRSDFDLAPVFGDESLPRLYENSRISSDQLPGQSGIVKRAVALGRFRQNPLAMVATLCGLEKEILSWKLCQLEHFLAPDEKYGVVEQVMVDATNQIGIDVNMACSHEWLFAPLQFISGLGPRKASALQRELVKNGSVFGRKEITLGVLRKKVFINSAGFLRVRRSGAAATSSHIIDLLDDTRIHPESYDLAKKMAKDAYSHELGEDPNDMDEDAQEMAIEHVRENPDTLKALKVDEYAKSIEEDLGTRKRETLCDIKRELLHGFQDWRITYSEPNQDEEFEMISGETDETISEGRIVQVTVRFVQEERVVCHFDSGLKGFISIQDFADKELEPSELQEMVHEGDILTCKIKHIQKARCLVYLSHKESDLRRKHYQKPRLEYFEENHTVIRGDHDRALKEKAQAKSRVRPRMIVHPRFQNLTKEEAKKFLSDKEAGESIIHPSSRGPSYLTLTLKVYDGVYAHKEIIESGKDNKDITSLLRLGKKLSIGDDTFEDLDELMDRYVDPLVANLKNMIGYRKFRVGDRNQVDMLLKADKSENPMRIVYCFGIAHDYPGSFILTYIRSSNPHHEYIGLYPKGFKFRKREFTDIDHLVSHFQRHINDPPIPDISSLAAVVPISDPATGGSSDRWKGQMDSNDGRSSFPSRNGSRFDRGSGAPRPYGRGGGGGRGRGNNSSESGHGLSKWGSGARDSDDGLSSFPGAKVQNSPGKERFPGSWGGGSSGTGADWGGSGGAGGSNWSSGGGSWGRSGGERKDGDSWGKGGGKDGDGNGGESWGGASRDWNSSAQKSSDEGKEWDDPARLVPPPGGSRWSADGGGDGW